MLSKEPTINIVLFISVCLAVGLILFLTVLKDKQINGEVSCTQEAMICPDGSAVGRTGPNCEFAKCPETSDKLPVTSDPVDTKSWKTYLNESQGFSVMYPQSWFVNFEQENGPTEIASEPKEQYGHGGILPSGGMEVSITKGICNKHSGNWEEQYEGEKIKTLEKIICMDGFQIYLRNNNLSDARSEKLLEAIVETFKIIK